jgi:flavorubredoxin
VKSLIIHDSMYANTEKITQAIGYEMQTRGVTCVISIQETNLADVKGIDLSVGRS